MFPAVRRNCAFVITCIGGLFTALAANAQPANNLCANATPAFAGATTTGTAAGATNEGLCPSSCPAAQVGDVFHTFTTTLAGTYTFSLCSGTNWDTVISIHTGCSPDPTSEVDCNDDGCSTISVGVASVLRTYLAASTTYIIRISGYDSSSALGPYALTITAPPAHTGACCFAGFCGVQPAVGCSLGTYKGDFTACAQPSGTPTIYPGTGTPAAIPDNSPTGLSRSVTIPTSYTVADVRLGLNLTHMYMGDLTITLSHGATTITVLQRPGLNPPSNPFGFDLDIIGAYTFADTGAQSAWDAAATQPASSTMLPTGTYLCSDGMAVVSSLRQAFAGQNASGVWTLFISDSSPPDQGTLNSWSLSIDSSLGDPCQVAAPGGVLLGAGQGGLGTTCTMTATAAACGAGTFRGAGVACYNNGTNNPVACCKANFDGINGVQIDDIFAFLNAWFMKLPSTDIDGTNGVQIDDIFAFLNAWFAGCR